MFSSAVARGEGGGRREGGGREGGGRRETQTGCRLLGQSERSFVTETFCTPGGEGVGWSPSR